MARTLSNMLPLNTSAPNFILPDTISGENLSLKELASNIGTVIIFMCNHCPFVKIILERLIAVANQYQAKDFRFIGINSNDIENYPEDAPEQMQILAKSLAVPFPYLYDESQNVAKAYDAACTPDFYLFDKDLKLVYRGQFDDARPGNNMPVTGADLCAAMDHLLQQKPIEFEQKPSLGCNIKWK